MEGNHFRQYLHAQFVTILVERRHEVRGRVIPLDFFAVDLVLERTNEEYLFARSPYAYRTSVAAAALLVLAFFSGTDGNAFIYFQF